MHKSANPVALSLPHIPFLFVLLDYQQLEGWINVEEKHTEMPEAMTQSISLINKIWIHIHPQKSKKSS